MALRSHAYAKSITDTVCVVGCRKNSSICTWCGASNSIDSVAELKAPCFKVVYLKAKTLDRHYFNKMPLKRMLLKTALLGKREVG